MQDFDFAKFDQI